MSVCIACVSGWHEECPEQPCCCGNIKTIVEDEDDDIRPSLLKHSGRGQSSDKGLKDQQSTGRKRAAVAYPLDRDAICEWAGLKFAGGGKVPIIGCHNNKQQARHHGPEKNTLNNDEGNVHRICHSDHNMWHAKNDEGYDWEAGLYIPHDSITKATLEEIIKANIYRKPSKNVVD